MLATFLGHVRSNVIAYAALFFALTAPATASIINGALIQNGSVTGADVKNESLTGADVLNDSLKGVDVDEASLGTVPSAAHAETAGDADTLDGKDSSDFGLHREVVDEVQHYPAPLDNARFTVDAFCPVGKVATGGGGFANPLGFQDGAAHVLQTFPDINDDRHWVTVVAVDEDFPAGASLVVGSRAVCVTP